MTEKKQKKQGNAMTRKTATGQADQKRDINSKSVLGNPILYAQFLRDNINIPCLKNVQPEDIEDVSERYRPYLGTEFESDTVKRVRIHGDNAADSDNRLQEHQTEKASVIPPLSQSCITKGKRHGRRHGISAAE